FFLEPITLSDRIEALRLHWPDLAITQSGDGMLMADARALESVLTNLVQNAVTHGDATEVDFKVRKSDGRLAVTVTDNGRGFPGDVGQLGKLFVRHARSSGSGVGLYIVRQLIKRMNGTIRFQSSESKGFVAEIDLPDGSGFELARHIKEKTSLPIMFMTALSTAEHRLEGFEIGAADFIPKPFHLRELLLRVKHVLDRHPVQREISCNGRVIELTNRVIVQPGGEREYPA